MRIFKNKLFARLSRKEDISDEKLCEAIRRAEKGQIDADIGGGVIKQRLSRPNEGKSGGYRAIILYRQGDKAFFVYGFAKNDEANITKDEEKAFKKAAPIMLRLSDEILKQQLKTGNLVEVKSDDQEI